MKRTVGNPIRALAGLALCVLAIGCRAPAPNEPAAVRTAEAPPVSPEMRRELADLAARLETDRDNPDLRIQYAYALADAGRYPPALEQADQVLRRQPASTAALLAQGRILLRAGQAKEAEQSLTRLLRLRPDDSSARLVLGYSYLDQGRYVEARTTLGEVAQGDGSIPDRISAWLGLAGVYNHQGQPQQVKECYEEAIRLDESIGEVLMSVAARSFIPAPVADPGRPTSARPVQSPAEVRRIVEEVQCARQ